MNALVKILSVCIMYVCRVCAYACAGMQECVRVRRPQTDTGCPVLLLDTLFL